MLCPELGRAWAEAGPGLGVLGVLSSVGAAACSLTPPGCVGHPGHAACAPQLGCVWLRAPRNAGAALGAPGVEAGAAVPPFGFAPGTSRVCDGLSSPGSTESSGAAPREGWEPPGAAGRRGALSGYSRGAAHPAGARQRGCSTPPSKLSPQIPAWCCHRLCCPGSIIIILALTACTSDSVWVTENFSFIS